MDVLTEILIEKTFREVFPVTTKTVSEILSAQRRGELEKKFTSVLIRKNSLYVASYDKALAVLKRAMAMQGALRQDIPDYDEVHFLDINVKDKKHLYVVELVLYAPVQEETRRLVGFSGKTYDLDNGQDLYYLQNTVPVALYLDMVRKFDDPTLLEV